MEFPTLLPSGNTALIMGHAYSPNYQRAKWLSDNILAKRLIKEFQTPRLIGLFENEYLQELWNFQQLTGGVFWACRSNVLVFINRVFIGDDECLKILLHRTYNIGLVLPEVESLEITQECKLDLLDLIESDTESKYVYMDISIDGRYAGTFVIRLYVNVCPKTCDHFLRYSRTTYEEKLDTGRAGYVGTSVHRIASPSFIQCGDINEDTPVFSDECYAVPHNRKGVVSFCNIGPDTNKCQFVICLNPNPWMDRKYVGFGQVVEGINLLDRIASVPTHYESPVKSIEIYDCGEISRKAIIQDSDFQLNINNNEESLKLATHDRVHTEDIRSDQFDAGRYQKGLYTLPLEFALYDQQFRSSFKYDPENLKSEVCNSSMSVEANTKQYYSVTNSNPAMYPGLPAEDVNNMSDEEIIALFDDVTKFSDEMPAPRNCDVTSYNSSGVDDFGVHKKLDGEESGVDENAMMGEEDQEMEIEMGEMENEEEQLEDEDEHFDKTTSQ